LRVGIGCDVHKLIQGRPLIIGGVEIPWEKGLAGHSDADVLTHAIMDALLGAAGLGDIGRHFPDTDEAYRDISSLLLLQQVGHMLRQNNYRIVNIDAVILAQKPKMLPYIPEMKDHISSVLRRDKRCINIKASTTENLGFVGREEGIAAQAVVLIENGRKV
jgi:2-C-methyl-D-erythritol 2,4-cyclodiphosphate synthase